MINAKFFKGSVFFLLLIFVLVTPTFIRMLKYGIFSMHDLHIIRLYEYEKCLLDLQIPCRFSPDISFGFGQPLFNFYGQLAYLFGEFFRLLGLSFIDSLKGLFITSIVLSALGMYMLGKRLWGSSWAGLLSAVVYTYAPYRAVDIYVRGALPEAVSFVYFPLIIYFLTDYVQKRKLRYLFIFGILMVALILTHNLSALMFSFFLLIWGIYLLYQNQAWFLVPRFLVAGLFILGLTAFYTLPVIGESNLVSLEKTREGYFDFRNHFVTLNELLISRYWGYGASLWGEDDRLSLSVGQLQWILPALIAGLLVIKRSFKPALSFLVIFSLGWMMLWLTHNKSTFLWNAFSPLAYIQFPWRFLGVAVFSFALASGYLMSFLRDSWQKIGAAAIITTLAIVLNVNFFTEDLWFFIDDSEQFSSKRYEQLISFGTIDYWPKFGKSHPVNFALPDPVLIEGSGSARLAEKKSNRASYIASIESQEAVLEIPQVYFPGWRAFSGSGELPIYPSEDLGLITVRLKQGDYNIKLFLTDTPIRKISNLISLASLLILGLIVFRFRKQIL